MVCARLCRLLPQGRKNNGFALATAWNQKKQELSIVQTPLAPPNLGGEEVTVFRLRGVSSAIPRHSSALLP